MNRDHNKRVHEIMSQTSDLIQIKEITWEQITRYAPWLRERSDLEARANSGEDKWDYVDRGHNLLPILRKNGGLAAIWLPREKGDGIYEWHRAFAVRLSPSHLFTIIQPTPLLRSFIATKEEMWIFGEKERRNDQQRWQEIMLSDRAIIPLVAMNPNTRTFNLHLSPQAIVIWYYTLPTMQMHEAELDAMQETPNGQPSIIQSSHWWRWNIAGWNPNAAKLGAQWVVGRFSGSHSGAIQWMRFIPHGYETNTLIFDMGQGRTPRFEAREIPKERQKEAIREFLLLTGAPEDTDVLDAEYIEEAKEKKKGKTPKPRNLERNKIKASTKKKKIDKEESKDVVDAEWQDVSTTKGDDKGNLDA